LEISPDALRKMKKGIHDNRTIRSEMCVCVPLAVREINIEILSANGLIERRTVPLNGKSETKDSALQMYTPDEKVVESLRPYLLKADRVVISGKKKDGEYVKPVLAVPKKGKS
jgi:hypothetical protein